MACFKYQQPKKLSKHKSGTNSCFKEDLSPVWMNKWICAEKQISPTTYLHVLKHLICTTAYMQAKSGLQNFFACRDPPSPEKLQWSSVKQKLAELWMNNLSLSPLKFANLLFAQLVHRSALPLHLINGMIQQLLNQKWIFCSTRAAIRYALSWM